MFVELLEQGDYFQATLHHPEEGAEIRKMLQPIGPVAVFERGNFPLAFSTAGGDTISALRQAALLSKLILIIP